MAWAKTIGTVRLARCGAWYVAPTPAKTIRAERDELLRIWTQPRAVARGPAVLDPRVAAHRPARLLQPLQERSEADL